MNTAFTASCYAAVASVALLSAGEAQAGTWRYDGHINGYQVESLYDSGSYGGTDIINIYGPAGKETISVVCSPFNWGSYGANTATWVDGIAREWCF